MTAPAGIVGQKIDTLNADTPQSVCLAVSMDTMVAGVHFHNTMPAADVGYKLLAVNLSDMAAMGAKPTAYQLISTVPARHEQWISQCLTALRVEAARWGLRELHAETAVGNLLLCLQIYGEVDPDIASLRSRASAGEAVMVTGTLGDAGLGVEIALGRRTVDPRYHPHFMHRLCHPTPRVEAGYRLRGIARSAIDISDGLLGDLAHICEASHVGMRLEPDRIPVSPELEAAVGKDAATQMACASGDDYELAFTCPHQQVPVAIERLAAIDVACARIGHTVCEPGIRFVGETGTASVRGYDHFR